MKNLRVIALAAILAFTVSGCSILYPNWGKPTDSPKPTETKTTPPGPTDTGTPTPDPTDKGAATVEIMDAFVDSPNGIILVVGQVTNFSEDGGTCSATFNGGGKTVTVSAAAESNAANTQCHPLEINLSGLPKGSGVITVTYDSTKNHGVSKATAVTIP
jgi:PBP1b-binding outer membrane lipoprotein LpoB